MFLKSKNKSNSYVGHGGNVVPDHYAGKTATKASVHSDTQQEWASPTKTQAMKVTKDGKLVVSVLVEVVGCENLHTYELTKHRIADAYVKCKFSKPIRKGSVVDLHKTKPVKYSNDPKFSIETQSTFLIDGLPVEDMQKCEGLHFKVKHHKHELGFCDIPTHQLLEANGLPMTIPLIHPIKLQPGVAGTLTVLVRPTEDEYAMYYYKSKGLGYIEEYKQASKEEQRTLRIESHPNAEVDTVTSAETPPPQTRSGWNKISWGFGSSNKKKSKGNSHSTITTPKIVLSPSHDEDLPTVDSSDRGSPSNAVPVETAKEAKTNATEADKKAAEPVEPEQELEKDTVAPTPAEEIRRDIYKEEEEETPNESLDVHTPKEKSICGGGACGFIFCGW